MIRTAREEYKEGTKLKLWIDMGNKSIENGGKTTFELKRCTVVKQYPYVVHMTYDTKYGTQSICMTPWEIDRILKAMALRGEKG